MAPVTEIAMLPLKSGEDPMTAGRAATVWQETVDSVLKQEGAQRLYWSTEVENPENFLVFIDWETIDHHIKFMELDTYPPKTPGLRSILGGKPIVCHVKMMSHPPTALIGTSPPTTEVITMYFPTSISSEGKKLVEENLAKLEQAIAKHAEGHTDISSGWAIEELPLPKNSSEMAKVFFMLIGWTSVEAHMTFRETQSFKDNIHYLRDLDKLDQTVVHVHCKDSGK